jgi:uncharacterized protein (TIGR01244 family)
MTSLLGRTSPGPAKWIFVSIVLSVMLVGGVAFATGIGSIEGFKAVNDRVAIGGQPTAEDVTALSTAGFNGIINLREESEFNDGPESHAAMASGIQFFRVPISKDHPSDAAVEKFLAITDAENIYPLYIHCASGNRAAALWMIRRVVREHWTLAKAESEADGLGLTSATMRDFARDYIQRYPAKSGRSGR